MPDSFRFLIILTLLAGVIYAGVWTLAHNPPEQTEVVKPVFNEKLRQK